MSISFDGNGPLKWAIWYPRVELRAEVIGESQIEDKGIRGQVRLSLVNTGRSNAINPRIQMDLPHWNFGRRQSGTEISVSVNVFEPGSEEAESADSDDSTGKSAPSANSNLADQSDNGGLNFSDCSLAVLDDRTGRIGGGEIYDIRINDVLPKNNEPEILCFGHVILDQGQSNTLSYTVTTQSQGAYSGEITFIGEYNTIEVESSPPRIWAERAAAAWNWVDSSASKIQTRLFGDREIGDVERIEPRDVLIEEADSNEKWFLPASLLRLSPRVSGPRDLIARIQIEVNRGERFEIVGEIEMKAHSVEPGEYWETTMTHDSYQKLVTGDADYAGPLEAPLPIQISKLGDDVDASDIQANWIEISAEEMPDRDNQRIEFAECELVDRGVPAFIGQVRNNNMKSRSPFIGAKFYAETNEILYTPVQLVQIEGEDNKRFRFEFRPTNPEYTDRIDRCEPFFY